MVNFARLNQLAGAVRDRAPQASVSAQRAQRDQSWYRIANANTATAEIYLYDIIGEWGVSAGDFVNDLRGVRSPAIDLHINCEGGEIFDGLAIYESLARHPATVRGIVDGVAASSASFILQACDEREMSARSRLMIHDGHGLMIGNAADMREMAALLDDLSDNIADIYAERAGGTRKQWRNAMLGPNRSSDGTWYDAQAAVAAGLADRVGRGGADDRSTASPVRSSIDEQIAHAGVVAEWNPAAFLSLAAEATAERLPAVDLSRLGSLIPSIPTNGKAGNA